MSRIDKLRNVVVIYAQTGGSWVASPFEVESDGTVTVGTEVTKTDAQGGLDAARLAVRQSAGENSAPYPTEEVLAEVVVPQNQLAQV